MEILSNGNEAYYEYLRLKDERDATERAREREHAERMKALETDEDAESHRAHAERMKALELGMDPSSLPHRPLAPIQEQEMHRREAVHVERMKALEVGIDPNQSRWPLALVCVALGGVPVGIALALGQASHELNFDQRNWPIVAWVGVPAVLSSAALAWRGLASGGRAVHPARMPRDVPKPEPGPEAFDLALRGR